MTRPYAEVIGDPVAQSKSPAIHKFWLEKLGIEGEYRATRVTIDDIAGYLAKRRDDPAWRGCNVTMPLKQAVAPYLLGFDWSAIEIGAVNTIVRHDNGALTGLNTDDRGFLEPLEAMLEQEHLFRMARVLGTGGAARAIVFALAQYGVTIVLAGRDPAKARAILDEFGPESDDHAVALDHFASPTDFDFDDRGGCFDLVVNASPLGMRGQPPLAFDWSHAPPGSIVYDIVTDPVDTDFLKGARAAGFATIDGLAMLIGQAAVAFEKLFAVPAPRNHDAELRALLTA